MLGFLTKKNKDKGDWLKVSELELGMEIAVPRGEVFSNHFNRSENLNCANDDVLAEGEGDVLWDEIVSIEKVGEEQVWDIEVEGTHNFVAGHFASRSRGCLVVDEQEALKNYKNSDDLVFGGLYAHNTYVTGNIGAGTSTPYAKLSVAGGDTSTTLIGVDALTGFTGNLLDLKVASTSVFTINQAGNATSTNFAITSLGGGGGDLKVAADGSIYEGSDASGGASFGQAWEIDANGNLAPTTTINIYAPQNFAIASSSPFGQLSIESQAGSPAFVVGSSTATSFIVDSNGRVGIATTSPSSKFSIQGANDDVYLFQAFSSDSVTPHASFSLNQFAQPLYIGESGENSAWRSRLYTDDSERIIMRASGRIDWADGADEFVGDISIGRGAAGKLYVGTGGDGEYDGTLIAGNIGVGTTSPWAQLSVNSEAGNPAFVVGSSTATSFIVDKNGRVGMGTYSNLNAILTLQGASGLDILRIATSTSGDNIITISEWGGITQRVSSSTAFSIQMASGTPIFEVDTTSNTNAGIDITAGTGQTTNLLNLYSSGGTFLSGFTAAGGFHMNIASTTAIDILNGSGSRIFAVDSSNKFLLLATSSSPTFDTDGQFAIGNADATASGGRIWIRSGETTFRFQSDANTADYSEFFYQTSSSTPGDVMVVDPNAQSPVAETGAVKVASSGYSKNILGVVSTRGTSFNNPEDTRQHSPNFANVGLLGHVLTKVSLENGEIQAGDYLTSSEKYPGYAMKAIKSGPTLGQAIEDFNGYTASSTGFSELGMVTVFVNPGFQVMDDISQYFASEESGEISTSTGEISHPTLWANLFNYMKNFGFEIGQNFIKIVNLVTDKILAKQVETEILCVEDVCIDRDQLAAILASSDISGSGSGSTPQNDEVIAGQVPQNDEVIAGQSSSSDSNTTDTSTTTSSTTDTGGTSTPQNDEVIAGQVPQNDEVIAGQAPQDGEVIVEQESSSDTISTQEESLSDPISDPITEPSTSEPTSESASEPETASAPEPASEPVSEPPPAPALAPEPAPAPAEPAPTE